MVLKDNISLIVTYCIYFILMWMLAFRYNEIHSLVEGTLFHSNYLSTVAVAVEKLVDLFYSDVVRVENGVDFQGFKVLIDKHCDGFLIILFTALNVLVFPLASMKGRLFTLLVTLAFFYVLNIFRISHVLIAGALSGLQYAVWLHETIWPILMIALSFVFFCSWAFWVVLRNQSQISHVHFNH